MARIVYVNGQYLPYREAAVHVEDRGFQFADAVYEVCEIFKGRLTDLSGHLDRLNRSLLELDIPQPMPRAALLNVIRELMRRNRVRDGLLYLQVTRGAAPRDFFIPRPALTPTVVALARSVPRQRGEVTAAKGIRVVTMADQRWKRPDIKTTLLLPQVLARETARQKGAAEAWLVDADGFVTEGAASNAWIVTKDNKLVTRPSGEAILKGITRQTVLKLAEKLGLTVEKRKFTVAEAKAAQEAFITAATAVVMPVIAIDDSPIGNGQPGPLAAQLRQKLYTVAEQWG